MFSSWIHNEVYTKLYVLQNCSRNRIFEKQLANFFSIILTSAQFIFYCMPDINITCISQWHFLAAWLFKKVKTTCIYHRSFNWPNFWSSLIASALMMELVLKMVLRMVKPWLSLTFVLQPFFSRSSIQFRLLSNTAINRIVLPLAPDASTSAPDNIYTSI